ncbi:MAG: efflux RND transporter periplasmic adaptor subunit [Firmicutes bacterium]|nr:efflux RND transporter periplasmic adaptor subunit [Bacillota bacterium]
MKKWITCILLVSLTLSLMGCGSDENAVYVQSVADLTSWGAIAPGDRFAGMVVSENVTEIKKDSDKTVGELLVKEGDDVTEGQELFNYDTDELQLALDKQKLELEQLEATIENYKEQIEDLEEDRENADSSDQLQYTIQIQTLQIDLKEAELSIKAKKTATEQSEALLENTSVLSPVSGRIQSINENGTDNYGNPLPYITIQQAGSYRVKGILGELQRGQIVEGLRVKILSRTDADQYWLGTVSLVDYENPTQGNEYEMYYGVSSDEMTASSKYPFYIELDSVDGLLLGQHVYIEMDMGDDATDTLKLDASFICFEEDGSAYVWAENGNKLEKRSVTVGAFDDMMWAYEIIDGLTTDDYIAFPDELLCHEGVPTTHTEPEPEELDETSDGVIMNTTTGTEEIILTDDIMIEEEIMIEDAITMEEEVE